MIFNTLPHFPLFFMSLMTSIFITLSSNSWLFIWIGLELNLLSFIPMAMFWNNNNETEAMVKYFLTQAVASGIMLTCIFSSYTLLMSKTTSFIMFSLLTLMLLLKLGAAPCHFWFPQVMNNLPWYSAIGLATIQKINPILILMYLPNMWKLNLMFTIVLMNSLVAGIGGLNQTQMKPLIAYSSIGHMSWMFTIPMLSTSLSILYLIFYLFITYSLMSFLLKFKSFSLNQFNFLSSAPFYFNMMIFLNLLSLAGLPPLLGFFPKWTLLNLLAPSLPLFSFILITGSLLTLFYYLSIFFSSILNSSKSLKFNSFNYINNMILITILPMFLFLMFLYAMTMFY